MFHAVNAPHIRKAGLNRRLPIVIAVVFANAAGEITIDTQRIRNRVGLLMANLMIYILTWCHEKLRNQNQGNGRFAGTARDNICRLIAYIDLPEKRCLENGQ